MNIILYLIAHLLFVLAMAKLVDAFYEKRRTSFRTMALSLLLVYAMFILIQMPIDSIPGWVWVLEIPAVFIGCVIIALNYESTTTKRLIAALYSSMIMLLLWLVIGNLAFHVLIPEWHWATGIAVVNAVRGAIGYLISRWIRRYQGIQKKVVFSPPALIGPLTCVMLQVILFSTDVASALDVAIEIVMVVGLFMGLLLIAWLIFSNFFLFGMLATKYEDKLQSEREAQEKEYYYTQCQLMQESAEQVRAVRHDMKLHLASLKGFTGNGSMEEIKHYLDSLVEAIEKNEVYSNSGNIAFDSIINYKLQNIKSDNIKLDLTVAVPPELNVEVVDIVTIIGNLLDNALEAVAKVNEKLIKIDIKFGKGGLFAKIENSFDGEVRYNNNSAERSIVSLKESNEHGYGLKNIKQSVEKYNGHIKVSYTENVFSTGVFLYIRD